MDDARLNVALATTAAMAGAAVVNHVRSFLCQDGCTLLTHGRRPAVQVRVLDLVKVGKAAQ